MYLVRMSESDFLNFFLFKKLSEHFQPICCIAIKLSLAALRRRFFSFSLPANMDSLSTRLSGSYPKLELCLVGSQTVVGHDVHLHVGQQVRVGKCRGYGGYIHVKFLDTWGKFFESNIHAYDAA